MEAHRGGDVEEQLAGGLDAAGRDRLVRMLLPFLDRALEHVRSSAEDGHAGFAAMWADGYGAMNRRSREWLVRERARLAGSGSPRRDRYTRQVHA